MTSRTRLGIALRHLTARPAQSLAVAALLAFSTALACTLFLLVQGLQTALIRATEPFELLAGSGGSPYQLVLNTVFLQDSPIGNLPWEAFLVLSEDPRVESVVPLAFGDTVKSFPLVGTTSDILKIRIRPADPRWFRLSEGRMFERDFEAVLGAEAAATLGLRAGDTFRSSHGLVGGEEHDTPYTVVGVAKPVRGPWDRAVFVSLGSVWASHTHGEHGTEGYEKGVTAIRVHPRSYMDAYSLAADYRNDATRQLVFPSQVTIRLLSLIGRGERFLFVVVRAVAGGTVLTTILALYWSGMARNRERTLLRVLGVPARELAFIAWMEGTGITLAGATAGWLMSRCTAPAVFRLLKESTALSAAVPLSMEETLIPGVLFLAGSLAGLLPAWQNNREKSMRMS